MPPLWQGAPVNQPPDTHPSLNVTLLCPPFLCPRSLASSTVPSACVGACRRAGVDAKGHCQYAVVYALGVPSASTPSSRPSCNPLQVSSFRGRALRLPDNADVQAQVNAKYEDGEASGVGR